MKKKLTAMLVTLLFVIGSIMPVYVAPVNESPYPVHPTQYYIELQPFAAARGGPIGGTQPPPPGNYP
ncbi:MAG: hypothetical protein FWC73_05370 [Defluviitaleaceae bacterium]|nr:hypothetical protein [Defluviitaleaceae bacterium]